MSSLFVYSALQSLRASKLPFSSKPLILIGGSADPKRLCILTNTLRAKRKLIARSSSPNDASANSGAPPGDGGARSARETYVFSVAILGLLRNSNVSLLLILFSFCVERGQGSIIDFFSPHFCFHLMN